MVMSVRDSFLASAATAPFLRPFGERLTSQHRFSRKGTTPTSTFSSSRNAGGCMGGKREIPHALCLLRCVMERCFYRAFGKCGVGMINLLLRAARFEDFQYLPHHNPRTLKGWFSVANIRIGNYFWNCFHTSFIKNYAEHQHEPCLRAFLLYRSPSLRPAYNPNTPPHRT